ncbi:MAG: acyl transferase [Bacteroidota bacterium]
MDRSKFIALVTENPNFDFEFAALNLFRYQYKHNIVYQNWVDNLDVRIDDINSLEKIPFLPISAFKTHKLHCELKKQEQIFESSGTTGLVPSKHYVFDPSLYLNVAKLIFESIYGKVNSYCFLALLPSYLERSGSSLVAMVDSFIAQSDYEESGFYLYDHEALYTKLQKCKKKGVPTILFGVSFALLDFNAAYSIDFPELIVIETGGMKGRKKEITRAELHHQISKGFGVAYIHSEYGMTELFSQAYSQKDGVYSPGYTMKVLVKDATDPLELLQHGKSGIVNIIDLANIDSCAFIETQDLGRRYKDGSFEILGRLDQSDIRGCNLMVSDV